MIDIHCHMLPGIDDGAADVAQALEMARIAVADGIAAVVLTPHQMGAYVANRGCDIRRQVAEFQETLDRHDIPLRVFPGADVRIVEGLPAKIRSGEVVTLADRKRHVLLELPHDLYFPIEGLLEQLQQRGCDGILSHPERNQGLLRQPHLIDKLVQAGCLMQVTAGSLNGSMGEQPRQLAIRMLRRGLVHFVATDAHGTTSRRPRLRAAYDRIVELADRDVAHELCVANPQRVIQGMAIRKGTRQATSRRRASWLWGEKRRAAG